MERLMKTGSCAVALSCDDCGHSLPLDRAVTGCSECGGLLEYRYDLEKAGDIAGYAASNRALGLWRWKALFPPVADDALTTLGEGDTPLISAGRLGERMGLPHLWLKNDALMPTGSFKDRGFALAVSVARSHGLTRGFTYSSGNAGASFAAYAARAGIQATVFVEAAANETKVATICLYGARVYRLHYETSAQIFDALDQLARAGAYSFVNFINPVRHEAMKTYAYEICERLNWRAPDVMVHPVGTGGGIWGAWKGFQELRELGLIDRLPRMIGVQPAVCAPIVDAIVYGRDAAVRTGDASQTMAQSMAGDSMIHGGRRVLRAIRESDGTAIGATEAELTDAIVQLAAVGVAAEPSAAAPLAAIRSAREQGLIDADDTVVAVVTGSALKQPGVVQQIAPKPLGDVNADAAQWLALLDAPPRSA
jgi:threonine synthase